MDKKGLYEDDYLAELNRQLKEHPDYEGWMEFLPDPDGSSGSGVDGITRAGRDQFHRAYIQTAQKVEAEFEMQATQRDPRRT